MQEGNEVAKSGGSSLKYIRSITMVQCTHFAYVGKWLCGNIMTARTNGVPERSLHAAYIRRRNCDFRLSICLHEGGIETSMTHGFLPLLQRELAPDRAFTTISAFPKRVKSYTQYQG